MFHSHSRSHPLSLFIRDRPAEQDVKKLQAKIIKKRTGENIVSRDS
jgi:hypothetical protein